MKNKHGILAGLGLSALALDAHYGGLTSDIALNVHDKIICPIQDFGQDVVLGSSCVAGFDMVVGGLVAGLVGRLALSRKKTKKPLKRKSRLGLAAMCAGALAMGWVYTHTINNNRSLPFAPTVTEVQSSDDLQKRVERHRDNTDELHELALKFPESTSPVSPSQLNTIRQSAEELFERYAPGVRPPRLRESFLTWPSRGAFYNVAFGEAILHPNPDRVDERFLGTYAHEMAHRISANECRTQLLGWEILHRAFERDPSPRLLFALTKSHAKSVSDVLDRDGLEVETDFTNLWSDDGLTYGHAVLSRVQRVKPIEWRVEQSNAFATSSMVFYDQGVPQIRSSGADVRVATLSVDDKLVGVYMNDRYHPLEENPDLQGRAVVKMYGLFEQSSQKEFTLEPQFFPAADGEFCGTRKEFRQSFELWSTPRELTAQIAANETQLRSHGWIHARCIGIRQSSGKLLACYEIPRAYRVIGREIIPPIATMVVSRK